MFWGKYLAVFFSVNFLPNCLLQSAPLQGMGLIGNVFIKKWPFHPSLFSIIWFGIRLLLSSPQQGMFFAGHHLHREPLSDVSCIEFSILLMFIIFYFTDIYIALLLLC